MRDNAKMVKNGLFYGKNQVFSENRHKFEGIIGKNWLNSPKSFVKRPKQGFFGQKLRFS